MTDSLEKLQQTIKSCKKCSLCKNRQKVVFSKGNENAKIMLIGEAPGINENECGIPFVGKSGKLLDTLLEQADFNPEQDIYFCNTVKCRPVKNNKDRKPTNEEISACYDYLQIQINTIKPKIIILCGSTAAKVFGIKEPMQRIHGTCIKKDGIKLFPIYHPRASVPNAIKSEDLKKVKNFLIKE